MHSVHHTKCIAVTFCLLLTNRQTEQFSSPTGSCGLEEGDTEGDDGEEEGDEGRNEDENDYEVEEEEDEDEKDDHEVKDEDDHDNDYEVEEEKDEDDEDDDEYEIEEEEDEDEEDVEEEEEDEETVHFVIKSIRRRKRRSSTTKRPPQKRKKTKTQRKTPKPHICRDCKMPMWSTTGHTQFRGKRYCPHALGQMPKEDWLKQQRVAAGLTPTPSSVPRTTLWR